MEKDSEEYLARCLPYLHRSLNQECLQVHRPRTCEQAREVTEGFLQHYNEQRPNQARSCANHPPRVACATLPLLPAAPAMVDPDCWLHYMSKQAFARTIRADGSIKINHDSYYLKQALAGQQVICFVNAPQKCFDIWLAGGLLKQMPIKGLVGKRLPFEEYVLLMKQEARSEYRRYLQTHPRLSQARLWA